MASHGPVGDSEHLSKLLLLGDEQHHKFCV